MPPAVSAIRRDPDGEDIAIVVFAYRHSCFGYWRWSCCLSFG
jgi:hypothetical protein